MTLYSLNNHHPEFETKSSNFIADSSDVMGNVYLKANASIWFGAVIRGDNELISIGENTNIQDGCMLHTDIGYPLTIAENCTIGHKVILHGCTIGANSLIGMGAIILNGAKIGRNCIIGAGALVAENKVIEDNTLVMGMPAKFVRKISSDEADQITKSAEHYVENAKRFITGLAVL